MVDEHFVEFDSGEEVEMKVGEETPLVLASARVNMISTR